MGCGEGANFFVIFGVTEDIFFWFPSVCDTLYQPSTIDTILIQVVHLDMAESDPDLDQDTHLADIPN